MCVEVIMRITSVSFLLRRSIYYTICTRFDVSPVYHGDYVLKLAVLQCWANSMFRKRRMWWPPRHEALLPASSTWVHVTGFGEHVTCHTFLFLSIVFALRLWLREPQMWLSIGLRHVSCFRERKGLWGGGMALILLTIYWSNFQTLYFGQRILLCSDWSQPRRTMSLYGGIRPLRRIHFDSGRIKWSQLRSDEMRWAMWTHLDSFCPIDITAVLCRRAIKTWINTLMCDAKASIQSN